MSEPGAAPPTADPAAPAAGDEAVAPQAAAAQGERRVHLYEVADNQRERVLSGFDEQRAAIIKAVADQRKAAVTPIEAVKARQARAALGRSQAGDGGATKGAAGQRGHLGNEELQRLIAAEIAATIKSLVSDEVKIQLKALLSDLGATQAPTTAADDRSS